MKFYSGENRPPDELIAQFEENGLAAERLQREGRLLMRPEEDPLERREDQLGQLIQDGVGEGRAVWASFDWVRPVDLETALEQQERLTGLFDARQIVVKTAALEGAIERWSSAALRRAQSAHSGTIFASEDTLSMSRATPMPPS